MTSVCLLGVAFVAIKVLAYNHAYARGAGMSGRDDHALLTLVGETGKMRTEKR